MNTMKTVALYRSSILAAIFVFICSFLVLPEAIASSPESEAEDKLYHNLLDNYPKYGRPVSKWTEPVHVEVIFSLLQIKGLSGKEQVLSLLCQFTLKWFDHRLVWNTTEFEGQSIVTISALNVWTPVIGITNAAEKIRDIGWEQTYPLVVTSSGLVHWVITTDMPIQCNLNMRRYPFDEQNCSLVLSNIVDSAQMTNLYPALDNNTVMNYYTPSKEFSVNNVWLERVAFGDPDYPEAIVLCWISLQRRPTFQLLNILIPSVVLSLMAALVFAVPAEAGEKLSLSITVLLSFSVFLIVLSDNTPQTSVDVPIITMYLTVTIILAGLSLAITTFILNIHHSDPLRPMPLWLQSLLFHRLGCLMGITRADANDLGEDVVISSTAVMKKNDASVRNKTNSGFKQKVAPQYEMPEMNTTIPISSALERGIQDMLTELRTVTSRLQQGDRDDAIRGQWRLAARVIDRLFLIMFTIIIFIVTILMVVVFPLS